MNNLGLNIIELVSKGEFKFPQNKIIFFKKNSQNLNISFIANITKYHSIANKIQCCELTDKG